MATNTICIDSNITIPFISQEETSPIIHQLFGSFDQHNPRIIAPSLLVMENYSTIRKKVVRHQISPNQAQKAFTIIKQIPIELFSPTQPLLDQAYQIATQLNQTIIYDSLYLALAINQQAIFLTLDTKFLKPAKTLYPHCFTPKNYLAQYS